MKWNEYAKVGAALQTAFMEQEYSDTVTDCTSLLVKLDRLSLDIDHLLVALRSGDERESHCTLFAVPDQVYTDRTVPTEFWTGYEQFSMWEHLDIEQSPMGAWQARLLGFAISWMPLQGLGDYYRKRFIFSANDLRSAGSGTSRFARDPRVLPSAETDGEEIVLTYCYWSDWEGLVRCTERCMFEDNGTLLFARSLKAEEVTQEVLLEYNCGIEL